MFLLFSTFTFNLKHYIKELVFTSVLITSISLVFIICKIDQWLVPVELILLALIFKIVFKEKWIYSIWISVSGLFSYAVIQGIILLISIQFGFITAAETGQPFGFKTYLLQVLTSTIVTAIAVHIKINRQGFGFTFRIKAKNPLYASVAGLAIVISSVCFYLYNVIPHHSYFYLAVSSFVFLFLVLTYFSYKKDQSEFSFS